MCIVRMCFLPFGASLSVLQSEYSSGSMCVIPSLIMQEVSMYDKHMGTHNSSIVIKGSIMVVVFPIMIQSRLSAAALIKFVCGLMNG